MDVLVQQGLLASAIINGAKKEYSVEGTNIKLDVKAENIGSSIEATFANNTLTISGKNCSEGKKVLGGLLFKWAIISWFTIFL